MSIEMPEAAILTRQLQSEVIGKRVAGFELRDCEKLQRIGFVNKDPVAFEALVTQTVASVLSRGNTIVLKLTGQQNLVLNPEYGGEIFFYESDRASSSRYHLRLDFDDGSTLTARLTSMGGIYACSDDQLAGHYLVARDFDADKFEPVESRLSPAEFARFLAGAGRQLKSVLVGKDAFLVGLSNSAFQDVIFRARLHPKRRASDLSAAEARALYEAIRFVVDERLRLGGKTQFRDLYGRAGGYEPAMGPALKNRACPRCGTAVQKLAHGGGEVFICPACQIEPA